MTTSQEWAERLEGYVPRDRGEVDEGHLAKLFARMVAASDRVKLGKLSGIVDRAALAELKAVAIEALDAGLSVKLSKMYADYCGIKQA